MSELFDVPETKPRWRQLQEEHGIRTFLCDEFNEPIWTASIRPESCVMTGDSEKEAVINLIHEMKLPGWDSLSPR